MAQGDEFPRGLGEKFVPVIDDMVRAAKGLVLDGHGAHAALRDGLANQFFGQEGYPQPCAHSLDDGLRAGALPQRSQRQLMRGEHVIQKLASGTAALTQQKRLLGQLLQAQAFSSARGCPGGRINCR